MMRSRKSWRFLFMLAFGATAFTMLSVDWAEVDAQEVKAKAKKNRPERTGPAVVVVAPGAGKKLEHAALAKIIDTEVARLLAENKIPASGKSSDAEFLRRVSLDILGCIPTAEQVTAFLDSKDPDKRTKIIETLLADERFGRFHGELWSGLMLPRESNNRALDHKPMVNWLAEQFNKGTPINKVVSDVLTSTGTMDENAAVTYFVANPTVDKMTDNVSRMFLGVQLQCAQCHNHPFTDWKQKEYWGMAQFFMKVRLTATPQQAAKKGNSSGIVESDKAPNKKNGLPESAMKVSAKFLGGVEPALPAKDAFRPVLAQWLCSAENPYFAKAMVNRLWHHHFGRGLVNPVDDMHEDNTPSHPELLAALTEQFKSSNFDMKYLVRAICNSETYQRTSRPEAGNKDDVEFYSHRAVRAMHPEQLYESLASVTGFGREQPRKKDAPAGVPKKGPGGPREQFLNFFRVAEEPNVLDYEAGIPQVLRLMNSNVTNGLGGVVNKAMKDGSSPDQMIDRLYLTALSRRPTADETQRLTSYVQKQATPVAAYNDILWSMLNSSEFLLNH